MSPQNARGLILHVHATFTAQMQTCRSSLRFEKRNGLSYFFFNDRTQSSTHLPAEVWRLVRMATEIFCFTKGQACVLIKSQI